MHRPFSIAISTGLIVSGVVACVLTAPILVNNKELAAPLNPMGINGSPYGEVFAMAMQSPIDDYFHAGTDGSIHSHAPGETCDHDVHVHDEHCDHDHSKDLQSIEKPTASPSLKSRFRSMLVSLSNVRAVRTNPRPSSEGFKRHLRRQAEDKLRFAYRLDPSHYANYNALHFFLTEPEFGTRPELTPSAASLAQETFDYCIQKTDDPRPSLTAAAACTNILHLMFADRNSGGTRYSPEDMRKILQLLDHSIARYQTLAQEWETSGQWKALSPQRTQECLERHDFIVKIRNSAESAIIQFEGQPDAQLKNN